MLVLSPVGMDERTRARLRDLATLGDLLQPLDALGDQRVASDLSRAVEAAASRLVPRHVTVRVHGGDPDARAPVGERRAGRRSGAAATGR